jgi:hypothetical protein
VWRGNPKHVTEQNSALRTLNASSTLLLATTMADDAFGKSLVDDAWVFLSKHHSKLQDAIDWAPTDHELWGQEFLKRKVSGFECVYLSTSDVFIVGI